MCYTKISGGGIALEKQNITLSIPKDILIKVKHLAIDRNTSISGLLSETLAEMVRQHDAYQEAKARQSAIMKKGFDMGFKGKPAWNRESLHER
jgi:hypothetical protein